MNQELRNKLLLVIGLGVIILVVWWFGPKLLLVRYWFVQPRSFYECEWANGGDPTRAFYTQDATCRYRDKIYKLRS